MSSKFRILLAICAALSAGVAAPASAAGPPPSVLIIPDTAQDTLQSQLSIQQAQAQEQLAANEAAVQAELSANQARLQGQLAAEHASTQAQLAAAGGAAAPATAAQLGALSWLAARPLPGPLRTPLATMRLATLTPQLGRYFGTDQGVLVVRAPTHGVLKLQDGDVILSIGGRTPASSSQALRILTSYDPGEKIDLLVLREHRRIHLAAALPTLPAGS